MNDFLGGIYIYNANTSYFNMSYEYSLEITWLDPKADPFLLDVSGNYSSKTDMFVFPG